MTLLPYVDKKQLSERDICTKFITPALRQAGWDELTQLREEVSRPLETLLADALAPVAGELHVTH